MERTLELEYVFNNMKSALAPTIKYKKKIKNGGYYQGYDAQIKRMFWHLGTSEKLTQDIENELEFTWCKYHYFKCQLNSEKAYYHLKEFIEIQNSLGWLFDCEFTMTNPNPFSHEFTKN